VTCSQSRMYRQPSRVLYGKPAADGVWPPKRWFVALDCGHSVYLKDAPGVGSQIPCEACRAKELNAQLRTDRHFAGEVEGCGGDAVLDRMVP
jgi:hypothetical protein